MQNNIPLLDFDPTKEAIIEPTKIIKRRDIPQRVVLCFFREVIEKAREELKMEALKPVKSEMGGIPVYAGRYKGEEIAVAAAAVGAPLAAGAFEEIIARGGKKFIACGGAGVLDSSIASGDIVVPTSALRDEGTSYHYLPSDRNAYPSEKAVEAIVQTLEEQKVSYVKGKTWTTDAFYRETPKRVAKRKEQGCITVEMEASALFAVAEFRGVEIGQLLYGGDDVSGIEWDRRGFGEHIPARESLFWLAMEACIRL